MKSMLWSLAGLLAVTPPAVAESPDVFELGEILVVGAKDHGAAESGVARFPAARMEERRRLDLADAAALSPDVFAGRTGPRNEKMIYVRGFDLRQVPIFLDGIPVYVPFDGMPDPGRFGLFDAAEVSVARGFSSVLYGPNTLGGAINLVTARPARPHEARVTLGARSGEGFEGGVRAGLLRPRGYVQLALSAADRDHFRVPGDYRPAGAEDGGRRDNSDSRDVQVGFKIGWTPANGDEFAFGYSRLDGEKGVPPYGGDNPRTAPRYWRYPRWDKDSFYLLAHKALGPRLSLKPRLFYDAYRNTLDSYDDATYSTRTRPYAFHSVYDDYTFGGSVEAALDPNERRALRAAAHYKQDVHRERNNDGPQSEFSDETFGLSVEETRRIGQAWTLTLGLGYDRRESLKIEERSGRASKTYPANDNDAVNPQAGLFFAVTGGVYRATVAGKSRFPTLKDRYSYRLGTALPNPELEPERAIHYEIGYAGRLIGPLEGRWSLFHSRVRDVIQQVDRVAFDDAAGAWLYQLQNAGEARHQGVELGAAWPVHAAWKLGADYALVDRKNTSHPELKPLYTPKHRVLAYVEWTPLASLKVIPNVEYASSRYSTSDGDRTDAFWVAHVNLQWERYGWTFAAGVQNVFDELYELSEGYPEEGRNFYGRVSRRF